jgi:hypothetical protein
MEQLIAQLAQAMASGQGAGFNPDMMAQAGGATNIPMDPASAERMAQEQIGNQAGLDQITAMMGQYPIGQVDPYGAAPNVVGPSGYNRDGSAVPKPEMAPTPTAPSTQGPKQFMHNGQPIMLDPMQMEDDPNGYWDAQTQGNGQGQSFYAIDDEVFYVDQQGQPTQNTAQPSDRFQYSAPIDPTGDDYFKNELGQDYDQYMQMTPDQRLQYLNDPANGFVPPLY